MYLTKITVDTMTLQRHCIFDAYRWKQELYKAFTPVYENRPFLFRVIEKSTGTQVLVLSVKQPKVLPFGTWETKVVPENFYRSSRYVFDVEANPTVKHACFDDKGNKKKQGKRVGLKPEAYEGWFLRKLKDAGCEVKAVSVTPLGPKVCHRKGQTVTHLSTQFRGVLHVKDSGAFLKAATQGIGTGRAFGFGMMLLKQA
jgi:CRISPR system Cascade subunit CasE